MTAIEREALMLWMQCAEAAINRVGHMAMFPNDWREDTDALGVCSRTMAKARELLSMMPDGVRIPEPAR